MLLPVDEIIVGGTLDNLYYKSHQPPGVYVTSGSYIQPGRKRLINIDSNTTYPIRLLGDPLMSLPGATCDPEVGRLFTPGRNQGNQGPLYKRELNSDWTHTSEEAPDWAKRVKQET
ncbi:Hypothetical predicted protein [Pelobates cultripes]|uniref:Uncharacterized protein n=1 Tax=Pelobates cultripes TaxID=61616 RepID=A0AAD1SDI5_PELCU|nr:Hypothetical predicted protein [Pelobates cultripes]